MEIKKSKNANLEKRRSTHLLLGLILSLAFVWMSFEYKTYDKSEKYTAMNTSIEVEEGVIIPTPPPEKLEPPKVIPPQITTIVDNTIDVPNYDFSSETDGDDIIDEPFLIGDDGDEEEDEHQIFVFVEDFPSFPGGDDALYQYLSTIKYPRMASESAVQGTVYISFIVEKDGSVTNVNLERGIGMGCDEESLRIVKNMPKWSPGKQRGLAVRVKMNVPIRFVLQN
jgi:protein TonB